MGMWVSLLLSAPSTNLAPSSFIKLTMTYSWSSLSSQVLVLRDSDALLIHNEQTDYDRICVILVCDIQNGGRWKPMERCRNRSYTECFVPSKVVLGSLRRRMATCRLQLEADFETEIHCRWSMHKTMCFHGSTESHQCNSSKSERYYHFTCGAGVFLHLLLGFMAYVQLWSTRA